MRKFIAAAAVVASVVGIGATTASADSCHGDIVGGIASTWPFAHGDRSEFKPPKGGLALWVDTFSDGQPGAENQAIRDFCRG